MGILTPYRHGRLANQVRRRWCARWPSCPPWCAAVMAAPVLGSCPLSGGGKTKPTTTAETQPTDGRLVNCQGLGFWGYDFSGKTSTDLIRLFQAGGYGNVVTVKTRMEDTGSFGAVAGVINEFPGTKIVVISQDQDVSREISFIKTCVSAFGQSRIISIISRQDELDLNGDDYDPPEIDRQVNALKAALAAEGISGIPIGINLSLGYGLGPPTQGADQIFNYRHPTPDPATWEIESVNKGVPQGLDIIYLEGYPITAGWFQAAMWPKVIKPTAELLPAHTKIGVIGQCWEEWNQPDPDYALIKTPYDTWAASEFADRILVYLLYRGSNDVRGVSDCRIAPGELQPDGSVKLILPEVMRAVREICDLNNWTLV